MKKLKHSKYKNTAILFEILVRKLTSESMTSDKSVTIDIIKKYFGKNTELSKELQLYNSLVKEQFVSEAKALDYIRTCKDVHVKLNKSLLKRQRYNLVKEISNNFVFEKISKIRINNYKALASIYMLFEYEDKDNPKQLLECKSNIVDHCMLTSKVNSNKDKVIETFGEAAPMNNSNGYPVAMAEKRAKDRVILKLVGLHGDVYSEDEADEFKDAKPQNLRSKVEKSAKLEAFQNIPDDRLLLETDAPDMLPPANLIATTLPPKEDGSPVNHPANLRRIYEVYSEWSGRDLDEVISSLSDNAANFLRKRSQ